MNMKNINDIKQIASFYFYVISVLRDKRKYKIQETNEAILICELEPFTFFKFLSFHYIITNLWVQRDLSTVESSIMKLDIILLFIVSNGVT